MRSHFALGRGALACVASGGSGLAVGICPAAPLASDSASDPAYADGWQASDNGCFGFSAWNFDGTYSSLIQHALDNGSRLGGTGSSQFNNIGQAWTLFNPNGPNVG